MRSGAMSGSRKETGTRQALGWPLRSTMNTSPSRATRSRTSPGELRSSIIFKVLKSIFKIRPSMSDLGARPGAAVVAPDLILVEPLGGAADDEGQVVHAGIPHRRMQVTDVATLVAMLRVGDRGRVDENARHLVRVVVGEFNRQDVVPAVRGLERRAGVDLAVGGGAKFDQREGPLCFGEFALYPVDVHRRPQYSPPRFSFMVSGFLVPSSADVARPTGLISPLGRIWIGMSSSLFKSLSNSSIFDWLIDTSTGYSSIMIVAQCNTIACKINDKYRLWIS